MQQTKWRVITALVVVLAVSATAGCVASMAPSVTSNAAAPDASITAEAKAGTATLTPEMDHSGAHAAATPTPSAYRELLNSEVRGLDPDTISEYLEGAGMGLALPAELNGYPGPRHVLDLSAELKLTPEQAKQIQALFDEMQPQAIELGRQILDTEAGLERDFRNRTITEESLRTQLQQAGDLQAQLRFVHLSTHLATIEILSAHQIQQYNSLRGYAEMPDEYAGMLREGRG